MLLPLLASAFGSNQGWPDSSVGVHTFLTFDSGVPPTSINASRLQGYDFVWGSSGAPRLAAYHKEDPGLAVSFYIPYVLLVQKMGIGF